MRFDKYYVLKLALHHAPEYIYHSQSFMFLEIFFSKSLFNTCDFILIFDMYSLLFTCLNSQSVFKMYTYSSFPSSTFFFAPLSVCLT